MNSKKKVKLNQQNSDSKDTEINRKPCFAQGAVPLKSSGLDFLEKETALLNENNINSLKKTGTGESRRTEGLNEKSAGKSLRNESDSSESFGSDFSDVNGSDLESALEDEDDSDINGSDNEVQVDFEFENYSDIGMKISYSTCTCVQTYMKVYTTCTCAHTYMKVYTT